MLRGVPTWGVKAMVFLQVIIKVNIYSRNFVVLNFAKFFLTKAQSPRRRKNLCHFCVFVLYCLRLIKINK